MFFIIVLMIVSITMALYGGAVSGYKYGGLEFFKSFYDSAPVFLRGNCLLIFIAGIFLFFLSLFILNARKGNGSKFLGILFIILAAPSIVYGAFLCGYKFLHLAFLEPVYNTAPEVFKIWCAALFFGGIVLLAVAIVILVVRHKRMVDNYEATESSSNTTYRSTSSSSSSSSAAETLLSASGDWFPGPGSTQAMRTQEGDYVIHVESDRPVSIGLYIVKDVKNMFYARQRQTGGPIGPFVALFSTGDEDGQYMLIVSTDRFPNPVDDRNELYAAFIYTDRYGDITDSVFQPRRDGQIKFAAYCSGINDVYNKIMRTPWRNVVNEAYQYKYVKRFEDVVISKLDSQKKKDYIRSIFNKIHQI